MAHLALSALQHLQFWIDYFHIRHKWSLAWEGVSCIIRWPLTVTYIFQVIQPWLCNKTAKIWHILPCLLYSTYRCVRGCVTREDLWPGPISSRLFICDAYLYYHIHMWHKYNPWGDDIYVYVSCTFSRSIGQRSRSQGLLKFLRSVRGVS